MRYSPIFDIILRYFDFSTNPVDTALEWRSNHIIRCHLIYITGIPTINATIPNIR
ncbi:hypothetical protein BN164_1760029 [Clostridioides difficile T20]|nr:hypothetical protein BN163_1870030 [Clostridioides difficile T5]CCK92125.1 hypothetical protein BN164_1760029 [Clostridioides difficile T20]